MPFMLPNFSSDITIGETRIYSEPRSKDAERHVKNDCKCRGMKAGKEHRVPLSARALTILGEMEPLRQIGDGQNDADAFVFSGGSHGRPLSNMAFLMLLRRLKRDDLTAHGFRSTFRDWAAERTNFPSEVAEMALAHAIGDKVEAAYRRGDLFERRRGIMTAWSRYCDSIKVDIDAIP